MGTRQVRCVVPGSFACHKWRNDANRGTVEFGEHHFSDTALYLVAALLTAKLATKIRNAFVLSRLPSCTPAPRRWQITLEVPVADGNVNPSPILRNSLNRNSKIKGAELIVRLLLRG